MRRSHRHSGFTLVELVVVMAIIGILVATLIVGVSAARKMILARNTRKAISEISLGLETFHSDFKDYPPSMPRVPSDLAKPKTEPASGDMPTGAANLVYYLRGPANSGWGFAAGGLTPFGTTAKQSYGPHYQATEDRVKYSGTAVAGFLDFFNPAGVILYFKARRKPASPDLLFEVSDNNNPVGADTDSTKNYAKGTSDGGTAFSQTVAFWQCTGMFFAGEGVSLPSFSRYQRQDYFLVSPGLDGRYGYVKKDSNGNTVPALYNDGGAKNDDIGNW